MGKLGPLCPVCGKGRIVIMLNYAYIGINPFLKVKHNGTKATVNCRQQGRKPCWWILFTSLELYQFLPLENLPTSPLIVGAIGYLSTMMLPTYH